MAHTKQVLRCAPEQVRFATSEERTLVGTPQAELPRLVPQSYPTEQSRVCSCPAPARASSAPPVEPAEPDSQSSPHAEETPARPAVESARPSEVLAKLPDNENHLHRFKKLIQTVLKRQAMRSASNPVPVAMVPFKDACLEGTAPSPFGVQLPFVRMILWISCEKLFQN